MNELTEKEIEKAALQYIYHVKNPCRRLYEKIAFRAGALWAKDMLMLEVKDWDAKFMLESKQQAEEIGSVDRVK